MSEKELGNMFLVKSGSHYSGDYGDCVETIKSKNFGLMFCLRLDEACVNMWFKESELQRV